MADKNMASWVWVSESLNVSFYKCSLCGHRVSAIEEQKNCSNCGAEMEGQKIILSK